MDDWRIKLIGDQWGWALGDGLLMWGYSTKAEAIQAVDVYKRIDAAGLPLGRYICTPPEMPEFPTNV